jgi:hypothetical protein
LKTLPKTLDDTYARILCSIDEEYGQDVIKVLHWLAYSARPLKLAELAEVVAIDVEHNSHFDPGNRLREPRDILTICSTLISISPTTKKNGISSEKYDKAGENAEGDEKSEDDEDERADDENGNDEDLEVEARFAHFSVKEYLVSDRIQDGPASRYSIKSSADDYIAQACLNYLLYFKGDKMLTSQNYEDFPLADYASRNWWRHALRKSANTDKIELLAVDLLANEDSFLNWVRIHDLDEWGLSDMSAEDNLSKTLDDIASPLYYASITGLTTLVRLLIESGADVNMQGGAFGSILNAASSSGYVSIVELLLEKGAKRNTKHEPHEGATYELYGDALYVASLCGNYAVVKLLLERGFDANARGGKYGNVLQAASCWGNGDVVRLLLQARADVNAQGGHYGSALQAAAFSGEEYVVQMLLDAGADVNAHGGEYGSALQAAEVGRIFWYPVSPVGTRERHEKTIELLLKAGAEQSKEQSQ